MYSESDILDHPEVPKSKPNSTFILLYIELSFVLLFGAVLFWGISSIFTPIFVFCLVIYASIAPFLKPQFTKGNSLRRILGIWNLIQVFLLGLAALFIIQAWPSVFYLLVSSLFSLVVYYLVLPFVESHKIKSIRFLSVLLWGVGFSASFMGIIFQLNNWPYIFPLFIFGTILIGFATLMMLFQLMTNKEKPLYYWFYLPRVLGLLVAWLVIYFFV